MLKSKNSIDILKAPKGKSPKGQEKADGTAPKSVKLPGTKPMNVGK